MSLDLQNHNGLLQYHTLINRPTGVLGIAFVGHGYAPEQHSHCEVETYMFVQGTGKLTKNSKSYSRKSPHVEKITGSLPHCMTPITSDGVVLLYMFSKGPFESIVYTIHDEQKKEYK